MTRLLFAACVAVCGFAIPAPAADPLDWPYWRGPRFDGISPEKDLPDSWDPAGGEGSNLVWKAPYGSRSTPIVMNGRVYLMTADKPDVPREEREKVVCLDAATGELVWERAFNVYLTDVPRERLGWSSAVGDPETGRVFVFGVCGNFLCVEGDTGEIVWEKSLHEEFGFLTTYGGRTNFPFVHENNVIISAVVIGWDQMAKPAHRFIAFDKRNGQPVWYESTRLLPEDTTYSAPVITAFNGRAALVVGAGDGSLYAFEPRTGRKIWQYDISTHGLNVSPLVVGAQVFCGHSEENTTSNDSGALFCIDGSKTGNITQTGELWKQTELMVGRASPLLAAGRLYAATDTGKLFVVDPNDGKVLDRKTLGTMVRGSPLFVDGKLFMNDVSRGCYIFKPTDAGLEQLARVRLEPGEECHGSPICSHGRIFLPSSDTLYCIGRPQWSGAVDAVAQPPQETPRGGEDAPAHVQIAPVEVLLRPGSEQPYHARLYNERGQYLRVASRDEVEFSITGPGQMTADGVYRIPADYAGHAAVFVSAKVGELTGTARIRVIPDLPWKWDFNDGQVPTPWIGCQYRHVVFDWDLMTRLRETDPQAAHLYLYMYSGLLNAGAPALTYDDSTPQQRWTELLRYLQLDASADKPKTREEAEAKLGPSLQRLVDERVLAGVEWSTWDRPTGEEGQTQPEPRLKVTKGARGVEGDGVMCKLMTIPKGARSQGWIGPTDLHDYTVQADVLGLARDGKLGDIGLIAQRYACVLMGAHQRLEIRTWHPQLERFSAELPFAWQADVWYTVKFQASTSGSAAVLRAKVWKRGDPEPTEWMVSAEDQVANLQGSPGFFGDAKVAEFFYDNLSVTPN